MLLHAANMSTPNHTNKKVSSVYSTIPMQPPHAQKRSMEPEPRANCHNDAAGKDNRLHHLTLRRALHQPCNQLLHGIPKVHVTAVSFYFVQLRVLYSGC